MKKQILANATNLSDFYFTILYSTGNSGKIQELELRGLHFLDECMHVYFIDFGFVAQGTDMASLKEDILLNFELYLNTIRSGNKPFDTPPEIIKAFEMVSRKKKKFKTDVSKISNYKQLTFIKDNLNQAAM